MTDEELEREQTHRENVLEALDAIHSCIAANKKPCDARALLWAGTYAYRRWAFRGLAQERERAIESAAEAVADFDEHYLGGKR